MSKKFYETEIGAVVARCTHDIVNASALSKGMARGIISRVDAGAALDPYDIKDTLQIVMERMDKINDSVDYLYEKIKKLQGF